MATTAERLAAIEESLNRMMEVLSSCADSETAGDYISNYDSEMEELDNQITSMEATVSALEHKLEVIKKLR